jgi:hypothetical protein
MHILEIKPKLGGDLIVILLADFEMKGKEDKDGFDERLKWGKKKMISATPNDEDYIQSLEGEWIDMTKRMSAWPEKRNAEMCSVSSFEEEDKRRKNVGII